MSVYYIDPIRGEGDGSCPEKAARDYRALKPVPGDSVLFRRGSLIRDSLDTVEGVTYGAWGEGDRPVFSAGVDLSAPECWTEEGGGVWSCDAPLPGDVGNLIFNGNECTATLRWEKKDLASVGDFYDEAFGCGANRQAGAKLMLFSGDNPGRVFSSVEAAVYGKYCVSRPRDNVTYCDLEFANSGVHGMQGSCVGVKISRCAFRRIGGCVWSHGQRIRFGNGVEFWNLGDGITVEDCEFENIYDSCITHQGDGDIRTARSFICRRNVFDTYGMAAFEYRDRLPIDSSFEENICRNAGCGFAMLGETLPRRSEIWPQPMGHHIFLWRIEGAEDGCGVRICRNRFENAPVGSAVYSIISAEAEEKLFFSENEYLGESTVFFGGRKWENGSDWEKTKK